MFFGWGYNVRVKKMLVGRKDDVRWGGGGGEKRGSGRERESYGDKGRGRLGGREHTREMISSCADRWVLQFLHPKMRLLVR